MKIERINDDKIKIIFNNIDLEENNISVHSFLANSIESQKLFKAILEIANEDFGFNTNNCEILYEAFSFENKTFVIYVTKSNNSKNKYLKDFHFSPKNNLQKNLRDASNSLSFFYKYNSSKNKLKKDFLIYKFENINDVFSFLNIIRMTAFKNIYYSLYNYKKTYFLLFTSIESQNFESFFSEFGNQIELSPLGLIKLKEFSTILIQNNKI